MPLRFIKTDILKVPADIIVNPSDGMSFVENKVSKAIAKAAGKDYLETIAKMEPFPVGNVMFTEGGDLSYKYIAHVALPDWYGGNKNEREYIDSCYSEVLYMADEKKCKSVVFPLLGVGLYGTPFHDAINVAARSIEAYLTIKDSLNIFVVTLDEAVFEYMKAQYPTYCLSSAQVEEFDATNSLDYKLSHLDYKFIDSLKYYMRRMEFTPAQCYNAAGIDKKLFSKIKNNASYLPSKNTIIKFVFALHLSLKEAQQLLGTCGYILSDSISEDVIVKHFLTHRIYDYEKLQKEFNERSL